VPSLAQLQLHVNSKSVYRQLQHRQLVVKTIFTAILSYPELDCRLQYFLEFVDMFSFYGAMIDL